MSTRKRYLSDFVLLSIAAIWGTTFVLVDDAIDLLPPFAFLFVRFGFAALLIFLLTRKTAHDDTNTPSQETRKSKQANILPNLGRGAIVGLFLFMGYGMQTFGLLYTTPGRSGFITGLSVALVPLLALFILRTRPGLTSWLGVGLAVIGLYLLAFTDLNSINQGDVITFICAIGFALQIIFTGKWSNIIPIRQLVILQLATVALVSALCSLLFEPWQAAMQPAILFQPTVLIALAITAVFATALAYLAQTTIQKYTSPTRVALIFASEPVFAALADYLWNNATLSPLALTGCTLILGGTILTEIRIGIFRKKQS